MARRRRTYGGGGESDTQPGGGRKGDNSGNSGNSSESNSQTMNAVDASGSITNPNGKSSNKSADANRSTVKRKKSCKSLTGIARVKCVLSKYKGQTGPIGPNML